MSIERNLRLVRNQGIKRPMLPLCMSIQQKESRHDNRRGVKFKLSKAFRQIKQQQAILCDLQFTSLD